MVKHSLCFFLFLFFMSFTSGYNFIFSLTKMKGVIMSTQINLTLCFCIVPSFPCILEKKKASHKMEEIH